MSDLPVVPFNADLTSGFMYFNANPEASESFKLFNAGNCYHCRRDFVYPGAVQVLGVDHATLRVLGLRPHRWLGQTGRIMGGRLCCPKGTGCIND